MLISPFKHKDYASVDHFKKITFIYTTNVNSLQNPVLFSYTSTMISYFPVFARKLSDEIY